MDRIEIDLYFQEVMLPLLLYSLLLFNGYGLKLDDLKNFRQWKSKTPGHPEFGHNFRC